jgi:hypothetical protein
VSPGDDVTVCVAVGDGELVGGGVVAGGAGVVRVGRGAGRRVGDRWTDGEGLGDADGLRDGLGGTDGLRDGLGDPEAAAGPAPDPGEP